jgi:DNA-directed RNA polymerase specialized sigma24 family protein
MTRPTLPTLCQRYAGEDATARELAAALRTLAPRRRRAMELYCDGLSLRQLGRKLRVSHGSARSLIRLAIRAAFKAARSLPRYTAGHPGPWRGRPHMGPPPRPGKHPRLTSKV